MPRGKKSKARAREKRRQNQDEAKGLNDAQAKAAEKGESLACSDQASGDAGPSTSAAGFPQGKAPTTNADMPHKRSGKGAKGQREKNGSSFMAPLSAGSKHMDLLSKKAAVLVSFLLCRYKMKQPARRGHMLKVINKRFKEHFPEIFDIARRRLDIAFGIEMEEVQPNGQAYMLVSKLDFKDDGSSSTELGVPNRGILIPLLSVIYLNGYSATEKEVWHFLNMLGVCDEVPHLIFGNVRKLITEDLVEEKYLEYCQIPDSDPPCYQFLWGPRAYAETSQATVKDFLAKISKAMPNAALSPYEQALIEEVEKIKAKSAYKPETKGKAKGHSKIKLSDPAP